MNMKKLTLLLLFVAAFAVNMVNAQVRYLNQVFTGYTKTTAIYGTNFTALTLPVTGHTMRQPLVMDVYQPTGDVETERPLAIYLHTGNFLPYPQNGSCGGTRTDSATVEMAIRLAKMGYVVAVADYRLGWNPLASGATGELTRRATLINAAYRAVQDVRTCIRYFKRNVAEAGNQWKVDTSRIAVIGQGSGGYISLTANSLDAYSEIIQTSIPHKFELPTGPNTFVPMVLPQYNGDIYGTSPTLGLSDATFNQLSGGAYPIGDTIFVPNHPGYSSDFQLAVNLGGAIGDSLWIEAGDSPVISFHVPTDPYAPCGTDLLIVPTTQENVVEVTGSCGVSTIVNRLGNNDIFKGIPASVDPFGAIGDGRNGGLEGFYPIPQADPTNSSPWEWFGAPTSPAGGSCNINSAQARLYIDTIIGYFAPRACLALNLPCGFVGTKEITPLQVGLEVAPVPAGEELFFTAEQPIRAINLFDLNGRLVQNITNIDANQFTMQRKGLQNGLYIAEVKFDQGFVKRKVVFANR